MYKFQYCPLDKIKSPINKYQKVPKLLVSYKLHVFLSIVISWMYFCSKNTEVNTIFKILLRLIYIYKTTMKLPIIYH